MTNTIRYEYVDEHTQLVEISATDVADAMVSLSYITTGISQKFKVPAVLITQALDAGMKKIESLPKLRLVE